MSTTTTLLTGYWDDYKLSGITYDDKMGDTYESNVSPYYVTYKDMNEIKNVINENNKSFAEFGKDIHDKIDSLEFGSSPTIITDEEENAIMNRLNIS